jgi:hypothetical protein
MISGTFFETLFDPTVLISLGLKVDNTVVSYGSKPDINRDRARTLEWNSVEASIQRYDPATFDDGRWRDVVGAYAVYTDVKPSEIIPRNLIGLRDRTGNRDGSGNDTYRTMVVLSTPGTMQLAATNLLRSFGVEDANIVQLDSGSTAGLCIDGVYHVYPDWLEGFPDLLPTVSRAIANAIVAYRDFTPRQTDPVRAPNGEPIHYVNFSGTVLRGLSGRAHVRSGPHRDYESLELLRAGTSLNFIGWCEGESIPDMWVGTPDNMWFIFRRGGGLGYIASAVVWGYPPR